MKDVVVFDEVAREGEGEPEFDAETIDTLKMFMQSGQYTRDKLEFYLAMLDRPGWEHCVDLAVEMRRRVGDQLRVIAPREFTQPAFKFHLNGR